MVMRFVSGDTYRDVVAMSALRPSPHRADCHAGRTWLLELDRRYRQPTSYNVKRSTTRVQATRTVGTTTAPTVTYNDSVLGGQPTTMW